ncbi:TIGR03960 family radical SAM protein [Aphanothece hegewaldii CCALA 016]|uniref:TIGR03960 family radical SAM protein n=1 Tax=Aphanothece hegewaldii CCALA 016 TaxID=2107694 RepID=A0A2T1M243_9CHRO|nr:TIGR03960 family B12-binding radical SAM protein [Aphanothece hegewaldii]PSF38760.1 TIGR03960 family radical SAM protein [Aphanothece hegewaldii CCALA 016]
MKVVTLENLLTPEITKPARYLGNELGSFHKQWEEASVRWVLTYPEVYEVGASNLGHIILYNILNAQPRQLCDRTYLPAPDLAAKLRATSTPLFALESRHSLSDFDILGFSLSYELGATNILEMLDLAGIPKTWQERANKHYPLIFAGGQTATSNPEPYADFFDFVALGDGEHLLPEIGLIVEEAKSANLSKEELLLDLAQIPGVYVPRFYDLAEDGSIQPNRPDVPPRILRRVATPIPAYSIGLVPFIETVHDRLVIEIRRGCTRGCRFCQPGMLTRPARDVEPTDVIETIEKGMRATGYNEFSLLSLSCSDYLALPAVGMEIKNRLKDENITLTLPSQRVDRFDENIANILGGTRQGGLTFAPEAGTQRLRDVVNKGLTNEELLRGIKTAVEQGWDRIKLYFMIGLPGETDEDVLGIAETVRWLRQECRMQKRKPLDFNITISNFTPKPHTPFQWHSVSTSEFIRKQDLLKQEFRTIKGTKVNYTDVRISAMEDFVGRGDRKLSAVVHRAWQLGAGMDAWWESLDQAHGAWSQAINEAGLSWKYRQVEAGEWNVFESESKTILDAPLPWDHIDSGVDKKWLQEDLNRAMMAAIVPDCSFEGCSHCGVCGVDFGHNVVIPAMEVPAFAGQFQPNIQRSQRMRVWFGKIGEMALVSHLDLVRLFDRVIRRAAIPISFTGGFHPGPRISIANALPLGATSSGEIVDFELTQRMEIEAFKEKLVSQLPSELPVYQVEEVYVNSPAATQLLEKAEYHITIATDETSEQWQTWIEQIEEQTEILWEKKTKSGKRVTVNLCEMLYELSLLSSNERSIVLRYVGSCRNDGTLLQPQQVIYMLEKIAQKEFDLLRVHRHSLFLAHPSSLNQAK